ncbi:hypothetical protein BDN72DRAFT_961635 [Pluteus cervinus]|uniref:Uncharacterized protein n=1 Tax=Pluteus cervinus TaxID=181527 RepID=A0ACD3AMX3_9AGAR|nr:hypothetical protein BDN72DRAFT_961635 [Pluteus cervinus]
MSTPSSSIFAQEILYEIVGHLHGDKETVKTLSVVSSSFLPICREVLFCSLHLNIRNCARWHSYLSACPSIGHFIQEVTIEVKGLLDAGEQRMMFVLDRIAGPRMISFRMLGHCELPDWSTMPKLFQDALSRTMSTPSIREIDIWMFDNLPISLFSSLPPLCKLQLTSCSFPTPTMLTPTSNVELRSSGPQVPKTRVDVLHLNSSHRPYGDNKCALDDWIGHLDFPLDLTHLSVMHVDLERRNERKIQNLLPICGQSLLHLSLSMGGGSLAASLQHLSTLRVLQLRICIVQGFGPHPALIIPGLLRALKSLEDHDHPPKEIVISAIIESDVVFGAVSIRHWEDLDSQLLKLSPVSVRIVTTCLHSSRSEDMPDWRLLLPTLNESGRLISKCEGP